MLKSLVSICMRKCQRKSKHLFVLRGSFVNGSSLISGLETNMDSGLSITGGMCGDDARFEKHLPRTRKIQKKASGSYWVLWLNIRGFVCQLRRLDSLWPRCHH
jgi:hypothetical protein